MALLDGDLQREIGTDTDLLAIMLDGTLHHKIKTLVNGREQVVNVDHTVKGFYDTRVNSVLGTSQRIAIILAFDLPLIPKVGDQIALEGNLNAIASVERDPATATYTLVLGQMT